MTTSNDPVGEAFCGQTSSLSPFLIAERTPIPVTIAIKPMAAPPVPINLGSSIVPVAILSTPTFDARNVSPTTVTLASAPVQLKGNGRPMASFAATLKGRTFSGQPVKGSESIVVVPQ